MTKEEFIAKYERWFSYTHREELKKQMENDLEDIELDGLDGYLFYKGYFDSYTNDGEFEVISRKVV